MERRKFLSWVGLGFLATSVPATIVSCQSSSVEAESESQDSTKSASSSNYIIGSVADLDAQGVLSGQPDFAKATVLVIRNPAAPDTLYALKSTCPHEGCNVEWKSDRSEFVCPCHAGRFAPDGALLGGPPKAPLETYTARIQGTEVIVSQS